MSIYDSLSLYCLSNLYSQKSFNTTGVNSINYGYSNL